MQAEFARLYSSGKVRTEEATEQWKGRTPPHCSPGDRSNWNVGLENARGPSAAGMIADAMAFELAYWW